VPPLRVRALPPHAHARPGATLPAAHEGRAAFLVRGYGQEPPRGHVRAPGGEQPAVITTVHGPAGTQLYERIIGACVALRCAALRCGRARARAPHVRATDPERR
jgi:hypothetical protein